MDTASTVNQERVPHREGSSGSRLGAASRYRRIQFGTERPMDSRAAPPAFRFEPRRLESYAEAADRMRPLRFAMALIAIVASCTAASVRAQDHRLEWSDDWARAHPASYAVVGSAVAGALLFDFVWDPGPEALVRGPTAFDAAWRGRLMAQSEEDRERAATLSDVLLGLLILWPFVDSLAVAGLGDMNSDVAWQLSMLAIEAYAADFLLSTIAKELVARERPHGARCSLEDRLANPARCGPSGRLRSFYSGHASAAFNAAGVVCMTHVHMPLYASTAADWFACGSALVTASVVVALRVIADRHYASDVLIGALLGLATGALLPYLLHFAWDPTPDPAEGAAMPLSSVSFPLAGSF